MTSLRILAATASLLALGACGTHKSVAPVAYEKDSASTGRVQNSPQRVVTNDTRVNKLYEAPPPPPSRPQPTADVESATLKPVSAVYLSENGQARAQNANYQAAAPATSTGGRMVTVMKGDTVYAIGRRYNADPKAIIAVNNMRAPYHLEIGQQIRLPGGAAAPTQTAAATAAGQDVRYRVKPGDTLYAISRQSGVSVAKLAQANGLVPPYTLSPGQEILAPGAGANLAAEPQMAMTAPAQQPTLTQPVQTQRVASATPTEPQPDVAELAQQASFSKPDDPDALFIWPVRGAIVSEFGIGELGKRNDGINIAAPSGTPVRAAADGEVVYRGSELEGFGNLLLVKHADGFVTAYAHNDSMLVKKGDVVRKGQVIAKVGQTGSVTTPQLHFEIRQKLKSVDPLTLLAAK